MGLTTVKWDKVIDLCSAKAGFPIVGDDQPRIQSLANAAARYIYDESRYHPRFLTIEPRTAARGYIEPTEDSFYAYGAGDGFVNGLYQRDGDANTKPQYSIFDDDGAFIGVKWDGAQWVIEALDYITVNGLRVTVGGDYLYMPGDTIYTNSDTGNTPPTTGWAAGVGSAPTPILRAVGEIDEVISYWNGARWVGSDPSEEYGYPDSTGFKLTTDKNGVVYVAYKKALADEFGDGTGGTVEDFPAEWLNYVAYSATRQFLASNRQAEGFNPIAIRDVDRMESQVLTKANRQGAFTTIANTFRNRYGKDNSISS